MTQDISDRIASDEEVGQRIAARLAAEQVASLADDEAKEHGILFWQNLHKIVCAHVPCEKELKKATKQQKLKMTDGESRRFGKQCIPWKGEYQGKQVDQVPMERLEWYADQHFTDELRRYLNSDRIRTERGLMTL